MLAVFKGKCVCIVSILSCILLQVHTVHDGYRREARCDYKIHSIFLSKHEVHPAQNGGYEENYGRQAHKVCAISMLVYFLNLR